MPPHAALAAFEVSAVSDVGLEASYRGLFRNRDFAVLFATGTQSQVGDQLARVALTVLVFTQTHSGFLTASAYALTMLPAFLGGILLSNLADTRPRRALLVGCDTARAVLFGAMAIPGVPIGVVCALIVLAVLIGTPYSAAEPAIVADLFTGAPYQVAVGLRTATQQAAQLLGFAVGGVVVAAIGAHAALLVDALTFVVSATALRAFLRWFPPVAAGRGGMRQLAVGVRAVAGDRRLRVLLGFAWLTAFWVVPEGLVAPYVSRFGGGDGAIGVLLAATPLGVLVGTVLLTRVTPPGLRDISLAPMAVVAGLPMIAFLTGPPVWLAALLLVVVGAFSSYLVLVIGEFVTTVEPTVRGQAIGLASSSLVAVQGLGLVLGGVLDAVWSTTTAIAVAGAGGTVLALLLARARHRLRARRTGGAHRAPANRVRQSSPKS